MLEQVNKKGAKIYFIDDVINFGTTYFDVDYIHHLGYKVQSPESIKMLKLKLNREKDIIDIELINKYLGV